ncbi:MAG: IS110 family transposase [Bacteriovoracaceae bacterium]|nr:IS110 family transposase [Bacteriovoracaceae bacterium]
MLVYTGIDYHKRTSTICFIFPDGKKDVKTVLSENLVKELVNRKNLLVGIEASCGVNHVVDQLKTAGINVKIINPNKFRGIGIGGKKTDIKDAEALAECLKVNFIPEVYHKGIGARRLKSLLRIREQYVQSRVSATNHTRGILREYGITINAGAENFWDEIAGKLEQLDFDILKQKLTDMVFESRRLAAKEKDVEESLKILLAGDPRAVYLQSIPGVGLMTTAALLAIGDDFSRFPNAKSFASYLGLVPSESSSGDKVRRGAITKAGQDLARKYLIHGARSILIFSNENSQEPIRRWAFKLKNKRGMNKATVALAHRLSRICYNVIVEERQYKKVI